jgi:hypothetical protein
VADVSGDLVDRVTVQRLVEPDPDSVDAAPLGRRQHGGHQRVLFHGRRVIVANGYPGTVTRVSSLAAAEGY